jgi:hypothetical protein
MEYFSSGHEEFHPMNLVLGLSSSGSGWEKGRIGGARPEVLSE